jgi:hypothetical protein
MQRQDYLERLIQQIAEFVARVAGLTAGANAAEAERQLDEAWMALGLRRSDAHRLDDATLRMLLGPKAVLGARLLEAEASLEEARSKFATADELRRRAVELRRP